MGRFSSPEDLAKVLWDQYGNTCANVLRELAEAVPEEFREEFIMGMEEEIDGLLPKEERYSYGKKLEVAGHLWQLSGQDDRGDELPAPTERSLMRQLDAINSLEEASDQIILLLVVIVAITILVDVIIHRGAWFDSIMLGVVTIQALLVTYPRLAYRRRMSRRSRAAESRRAKQ